MSHPQFGLLPAAHDRTKDFRVGAVSKLPLLADLPIRFHLPYSETWILEQTEDSCAGHASSLASSMQEGVRLDPLFTWVVARASQGMEPGAWGCDLQPIAAAHQKVGALELTDSPYKEGDTDWRDIAHWDINALFKKSVYHKKGAYVWIERTQGYDYFDTLRATLHQFKSPIVIGLRWPYGETPAIDTWVDGGFGHAVTVVGWDNDRLIIANSWGLDSGDNGEHRIARDVINKEMPVYGGFFFVDETPEKLRGYIANGITLNDSWILAVIKSLVGNLTKWVQRILKKQEELPGAIPSRYLLAALCWQESGFDPKAIGDKHLLHKAFGILQCRQPYIDDAVPGHRAEECLNNVPLSIQAFSAYMARYARASRIGVVTDEKIARMHNAGPNGWKRTASLPYWWQVRTKMQQLESGQAPQEIYQKITKYGL